MLEFHKFNEYLIHFSKAFSKLIKEQRALSCICRLKQNPENVHFIFTDSWKAKYARPWVRATQRNEVSAQKEFTVQFIKCLFPIHPAWHLSCLVLVSRNNLNTTVCKHQSPTLAASSFCESGPGRKGKIWQENYYVNQGKAWLMWLCKLQWDLSLRQKIAFWAKEAGRMTQTARPRAAGAGRAAPPACLKTVTRAMERAYPEPAWNTCRNVRNNLKPLNLKIMKSTNTRKTYSQIWYKKK